MSKPAAACWAPIAIKAESTGKSRLSGVLSAEEHQGLVEATLRHVTDISRRADCVARTMLFGPAPHGLDGRDELQSAVARTSAPCYAVYAACKAGINNLTRRTSEVDVSLINSAM